MDFWQVILNTLSFFALMMATLSFWVKRTFWLWGTFTLLALLLGYQAKIIGPVGLIPLTLLGISHWMIVHKATTGHPRNVFIGLAVILSIGLNFHLFPGFQNWKFAESLTLGEGATSYTFWINFDKPFIGIFLLAWMIPLAQSKIEIVKILKKAIPLSILGTALMIGLSLYLGVIKWDPKLPWIICIWPLTNLFFAVIPEEAFFRGFIQEEIFQRFKPFTGLASIFAVSLTAVFFALMHIGWVRDPTFLSLVFVAGCVYGTIYQLTKSIESSILCHILVNLTHILLFTYPTLQHK
ncbi:MAG: CPBP family intramembrane metalloprotease [Chlamydiales bacterium]|nr:CPBP family intramembrane metalloprotease [Chlamydiales bacterium]